MGYQEIDIIMINGKKYKGVIVFNAEELDMPDECGGLDVEKIDKVVMHNNK